MREMPLKIKVAATQQEQLSLSGKIRCIPEFESGQLVTQPSQDDPRSKSIQQIGPDIR
jgi:hypothetical protein